MSIPSLARLAVLAAVASVVAGCAATAGASERPSAPAVQLRLVTSSEAGACGSPTLTSTGPGTACDLDGASTYELAESLGTVTPASVTRSGQGDASTVVVTFDGADATTLGDATKQALGGKLALVIDGSVLAAATVLDPITTGTFTMGFATTSDADRAAASLEGSATP